MKFILTIDTEGDNQWDHGREVTVENIKFVPRFQELCNKYHVKPTYLVTSEICEDKFSQEILTGYQLNGDAEIGAHLHSWTTPPFLNEAGYRYNDENHAFASELPGNILIEKIKNLTGQIENSFGKRPFSFRSGRYGFDKNVAKVLADHSYVVDSSVTPYTSWSPLHGIPGGAGGPDFVDKAPFPYTYEFAENSLTEIPVTILPTKFPLNRNSKLTVKYFRNVNNNLILRGIRKAIFSDQPVWLRPLPSMSISLFNDLLEEALKLKLPYIVMMFHSSELMPGCSIYRPDQASIEKLYILLESFFDLLNVKKVDSLTLTEAAKSFKI